MPISFGSLAFILFVVAIVFVFKTINVVPQQHAWVVDAIRREKRLKKWLRDWKLALIETNNPEWLDLAADWYPVNDPNWTPPPEED